MLQGHIIYTSDFLLSARTIALAGRDLQEALTQNEPRAIEFAIAELEQAYMRYDQSSERYQMFMLGQLGTTRSAAQAERVSTDGLASLVTDFQVAHVLLAAGQAVGESGEPTRGVRAEAISPLTEAVESLEDTARMIRRPLAASLSEPPPATRGLLAAKAPTAVEPVHSLSLAAAIATLQTTTTDTLEDLVSRVREAIVACVEELSNLDEDDILRALRLLGMDLEGIPDVGRLIRLGIDRLKKAINAVVAWLGEETLERLKERLKEVLHQWLTGEQINVGLRYVLAVDDTQQMVKQAVSQPGLTIEKVDQASTEVKQLRVRFDEHMGLVTQAAKVVTVIGGLLTTSLGVQAVLISAVSYLAVIAWAVAMGIDYADSGRLLDRVEGVGAIIQKLVQQ
ncbi:MAG: hypothetical protein J7M34_14040 [Anaerolineae bacterium]|nr:hypothetical protein [Anaerolineae bacterium]